MVLIVLDYNLESVPEQFFMSVHCDSNIFSMWIFEILFMTLRPTLWTRFIICKNSFSFQNQNSSSVLVPFRFHFWFRSGSSSIPVIFQFCSSSILVVLFQFCSGSVPVLFQFCSCCPAPCIVPIGPL